MSKLTNFKNDELTQKEQTNTQGELLFSILKWKSSLFGYKSYNYSSGCNSGCGTSSYGHSGYNGGYNNHGGCR